MFEYVAEWISANRQLLSGLAALVAILGFVLSPLGKGLRGRVLFGRPTAERKTGEAPHRSSRPTVAVLPFKNSSGEADQNYLADGLTEDVITTLSYGSGFDVIARNSTFAYKGQPIDIREVGENLGATYVVEGSLRTIGENVRVTVQVNDAETGGQIWAEKFDQPMASFLDIQDDVVDSITCQIGPEIERVELSRDNQHATSDLGAWALVRRANVIFNSERNTRPNLDRIIEFAQKAIELDSDYPDAHGLLSRAYSVAVIFGETNDKERDLQLAEEAYFRMRDLAPNHADTFFTQGQLALANDEIELALTALKGAYERNPNNVLVLALLGLTATRLGHAQDGIDLIERALRLSPRDPTRHMNHFAAAAAALSIGDTEKAHFHAKRSVELFDEFPASLAIYAGVLRELGREKEARAQLKRIRDVSPGTTREEIVGGARWAAGLDDEQAEGFDRFLKEAGFG